VILCFRQSQRAFFVHGFAKSDKANLDADEVKIYKKLAKILFALSDADLGRALKSREFLEVECDEEDG
jgi:hypothetical protein